ncbi:hypothetical protein JNB11_00060 [Kocuria palustris]|nr:hypothetical protein [Kocuria palustris]
MLSFDLFRVILRFEMVVLVCLMTGMLMIILPLMAMFLFDIVGYVYLKYTNKITA